MLLTDQEHAALTIAAYSGEDVLERTIARIRKENPAAFHTKESLRERVFYDEPLNELPCARFVRPVAPALRLRIRSVTDPADV